MKYLFAGLGNPGEEYAHTRHNIGFEIMDEVARICGGTFKQGRLADVCETKYKSKILILIKPNTFMNLSGKAVKYWMDSEKIALSHVWVALDDLAIDFGTLRLRKNGSDGGHNGLKSIQEHLQTNQYGRLRFGVGNNFTKGRQVDYVLGKWNTEEQKLLPAYIERAANAMLTLAHAGADVAMNQFNTKPGV